MSGFEIAGVVILGIAVFTILYALIRVPWRLWRGDVEAAGSDASILRRDKPDRTEE